MPHLIEHSLRCEEGIHAGLATVAGDLFDLFPVAFAGAEGKEQRAKGKETEPGHDFGLRDSLFDIRYSSGLGGIFEYRISNKELRMMKF
jgi:hypothetical protein